MNKVWTHQARLKAEIKRAGKRNNRGSEQSAEKHEVRVCGVELPGPLRSHTHIGYTGAPGPLFWGMNQETWLWSQTWRKPNSPTASQESWKPHNARVSLLHPSLESQSGRATIIKVFRAVNTRRWISTGWRWEVWGNLPTCPVPNKSLRNSDLRVSCRGGSLA